LKRAEMFVSLGEPTTFADLSINLPADWEAQDTSDDSHILANLIDEKLGDELIVSRESGLTGGKLLEKIQVGDVKVNLLLQRKPRDDGVVYAVLSIARPMPHGRPLSIVLISATSGAREELQSRIDLIKRIAATVRIHSGENTET